MTDIDVIKAAARLAVCNFIPRVETIDGKAFQDASLAQQEELAEYVIVKTVQSICPSLKRRISPLAAPERKAYVIAAMDAITAGVADALGEFGLDVDIVLVDMGDQPHE